MKRYRIGQFSKEISVTIQTLRNWDHTGKLKPDYVSPSHHRYFPGKQLDYVGLIKELKEG